MKIVIRDAYIWGCLYLLDTGSTSTHNRTSDHVKRSYDSDSLADSNQTAAKNLEGMIHDEYSQLQFTHKVSTHPLPNYPLKLQSATVHSYQQSSQAKKDLRYFINPTTQPRSGDTSSKSSHSLSLYPTGQHGHHPSGTQFHQSTISLSPTSSQADTVRTIFTPSSIPQQPPRIISPAVTHRFSHTTITVMESSRYPYTADLLSLDECRAVVPSYTLPTECCHNTTPLDIQQWRQLLAHHPDKHLCKYIISGISQGFRIGFHRRATQLQSAQTNMTSAHLNPDPVDSYLTEEISAGRIVAVP